ncbi:hypothetical protein Hanom_Chr01g00044471 [Helianthus anomalus]
MYWKMRNEKSVFEFSKFYSLQPEGNLFHRYSKIWQVLEGDLGRLILVLVVCLYQEFGLVYSAERGLRSCEWCSCISPESLLLFCVHQVFSSHIKLIAISPIPRLMHKKWEDNKQ